MKRFAGFLVLVLVSCCDAQGFRPPGFGRPGFGPPGGSRGPPGGVPNFGGGPGRGGGDDFLTEPAKTCMKSCTARNLHCPVLPRERMTENCRSCLQLHCPNQDGVPAFMNEQCHVSKYTTCSSTFSCPAYTAADQQQFSQCVRCRDGCITPAMKADIAQKMKTSKACRDKCVTDNGCPEPPPRSCMQCIQRTCGNDGFTCLRTVYQSRRCPTCITGQLSRPDQSKLAKCRQCMDTCKPDSTKSGTQRRGERPDGNFRRNLNYVRHLTKSEALCLSRQCTGACPSLATRISQMNAMPVTCQTCLSTRCPDARETPEFDKLDCYSGAHAACVSSGCPAMSASEQTQKLNCRVCRDGCLTLTVKNRIREQMKAGDDDRSPRGDRRFGDRRDGDRGDGDRRDGGRRGGDRRDGDGGDRLYLPAQSQACITTNCRSLCSRNEAQRESLPQCRQCITVLCPIQDGVPHFDRMKCQHDSQSLCGPIFGCQALSQSALTNRSLCRNCMDRCIPESVKASVRTQMANTASCRAQCKTNMCSHRENCDACVDRVCAQSIYADCKTTAKTSSVCPVCFSMDQKDQQCRSCMTNCIPAPAAPAAPSGPAATLYPGPPVRTSNGQEENMDQCYRKCESYGCPMRDDESCTNCIESICQGSTYTNCEQLVRDGSSCQTCVKPNPNLTPDFMAFCKQCYGTCAADHANGSR